MVFMELSFHPTKHLSIIKVLSYMDKEGKEFKSYENVGEKCLTLEFCRFPHVVYVDWL